MFLFRISLKRVVPNWMLLMFLSFIAGINASNIGDCARSCIENSCTQFQFESVTGAQSDDGVCYSTLEDFAPGRTNWWNSQLYEPSSSTGLYCDAIIYLPVAFRREIRLSDTDSPCWVLVVTDADFQVKVTTNLTCENDLCDVEDVLLIHNVWKDANKTDVVSACVGPDPSQPELRVVSANGSYVMFELEKGASRAAEFDVVLSTPGKEYSPETIGEDDQADTVCDFVFDLAFILDSSSSVEEEEFELAKEFCANLTGEFTIGPDGVQVTVIIFDSTPTSQFYLNEFDDADSVQAAILAIEYGGGGTDTDEALEMAREENFLEENGHRPGVPKVIILITDGHSSDGSATIEQADLLKAEGYIVYAIGVGSGIDMDELEAIATDPSDVFELSSFDDLEDFLPVLQEDLCIDVERATLISAECTDCQDLVFDDYSDIDELECFRQADYVPTFYQGQSDTTSLLADIGRGELLVGFAVGLIGTLVLSLVVFQAVRVYKARQNKVKPWAQPRTQSPILFAMDTAAVPSQAPPTTRLS